MRYLLAVIALGGCATINDMAAREPVATYQSSRSASEVAACVAREVRGHGAPSVIPGEAETLVSFNPSGSNVVLQVTARRNGAGSVVEVRQAMNYFSRPAVERCVQPAA